MEAAAADEEVEGWRRELEAGRRIDLRRSVVAITGTEPDEPLVDVLWALLGPEVYLKLTVDAGRSRDECEAYATEGSRRLFGIAAPAPTRAR